MPPCSISRAANEFRCHAGCIALVAPADDALLGTATAPHIDKGEYPSERAIAKAWTTLKGKGHVSYFNNNLSCGITTRQEGEIKRWLPKMAKRMRDRRDPR